MHERRKPNALLGNKLVTPYEPMPVSPVGTIECTGQLPGAEDEDDKEGQAGKDGFEGGDRGTAGKELAVEAFSEWGVCPFEVRGEGLSLGTALLVCALDSADLLPD